MSKKTSKEILQEAFGKIKLSTLSTKELSEIRNLLDLKMTEVKFVQRVKKKRF